MSTPDISALLTELQAAVYDVHSLQYAQGTNFVLVAIPANSEHNTPSLLTCFASLFDHPDVFRRGEFSVR